MFLPLDRVVRLLRRPARRRVWTSTPATMDRSAAETLAHVAHELRQPLCAALAAFRVIRSSAHEPHRQHATAVIDRQLHRLGRLVDDLMETTRLRVHRPSLQISRLDFRQIAQDVVEAITPEAAAKRQHLTVAVARHPVLVDADSVRLQQVLSNLVTNAITYTGSGGLIRVSVENKGREAVVTVADTGQGISRELLHRIFEPFVQGGRAGTRSGRRPRGCAAAR